MTDAGTAAGLLGVDPAAFGLALDTDPEFRIAARYWTCRLRLAVGDAYLTLVVRDGRVADVRDAMTGFDPYDILLAGPPDVWARILEPVPFPFYQDFWSARFMHGFRTEGDLDSLCAYYRAVRRIGDVLRVLANKS